MANVFKFQKINSEASKKRYRLVDIAYALKISSDAIASYYQNRGISTKGGLTLDQIVEAIIHGNIGGRGGYVIEENAIEIRQRLRDEEHILLNEEVEDAQTKMVLPEREG